MARIPTHTIEDVLACRTTSAGRDDPVLPDRAPAQHARPDGARTGRPRRRWKPRCLQLPARAGEGACDGPVRAASSPTTSCGSPRSTSRWCAPQAWAHAGVCCLSPPSVRIAPVNGIPAFCSAACSGKLPRLACPGIAPRQRTLLCAPNACGKCRPWRVAGLERRQQPSSRAARIVVMTVAVPAIAQIPWISSRSRGAGSGRTRGRPCRDARQPA
jgi:hypothetical protein